MKKKKTIIIVSAVCLVLTLSACLLLKLIPDDPLPTPTNINPDKDYLYTILNGEAIITGIQPALTLDGAVTIPTTLGGFPVTGIGHEAFNECKSLTALTIPDSVTTIADRAFFSCDNLTSVTIGNGVTSIGTEAFSRCHSLTSITIPNSVTTIGEFAFCHSEKLTDITISDSVTNIGKYAFADTGYYDDTANWQNDVLYIGNHLITADDVIGAYMVKAGTKTLADSAFNHCKGLSAVTIPDSVTTIGKEAFTNCSGMTTITIGNGVTTIQDAAFSGCSDLTSVSMGNSVKCIGAQAFYKCTVLTSIAIPKSVTSIGEDVFCSCTSLTSITVDENNAAYSVQDGVLFNKEKTTLLCYPLGKTNIAYTVPNTVTRIERSAFRDCAALTSITIPDSVTSIGAQAFYDTGYYKDSANWDNEALYIGNYLIDTKMTADTYTIRPGTKVLADNAFAWRSELTSVNIPDSVTSIGNETFSNCGLTSITIPKNVTSIGDRVFLNCGHLPSITVEEHNRVYSVQDGVLFNKEKTTLLCYPAGKINAMYTVPNNVTNIGAYAFYSCNNLLTITFGNTVTAIGQGAFSYCNSLSGVQYVGSEAEASDMIIGDENTPLKSVDWHYN